MNKNKKKKQNNNNNNNNNKMSSSRGSVRDPEMNATINAERETCSS